MAITQPKGGLEKIDTSEHNPIHLGYKSILVLFVAVSALCLLTLVDVRRGFLFADYAVRTPYFVLSPFHLPMLILGLLGVFFSGRILVKREGRVDAQQLKVYVQVLAFVLFGLLVVDLFVYRGVAAGRAIAAGKLSAPWLDAFGVTGWLRPVALATSYLLNVWHATFLGALLAGLALTVLPNYLKSLFTKKGMGGSLFGSLFALPQPFCSCCAAVIVPSYVRRGASNSFSLAFVVGAPMLNVTGLILAATLLPAPYAITRVLAGVLLALPVTYGVAWLADRWTNGPASEEPLGWLGRWVSRWTDLYCRLFHLEELVEGRRMDTPSSFLASWLWASMRIAVLLVPTLFVLTILTSAVIQVLPGAFGNNVPSVVLAAVAGTLLMISTWTEVPVAQQMLAAGFNGPAATLLVVLPPVSLPCLMLLGGSTGNFRIVALLGLAVIAVGIGAGFAFL